MNEETQTHRFTEAPASWNIRYRVNGFDEQLTLRGESFASIKDQVDAAREYVKKHFAPNARAALDAVNTETHSPTVAAASSPVVSAAPVTVSTDDPVATQVKINTLIATKMEVAPRADGKVDIKLYGAGHQYPDLTKVCDPVSAVALFASTGAWTVEHFAGPGSYPVKMIVEWVESEKLNKAGKPYKNIVAVKPA